MTTNAIPHRALQPHYRNACALLHLPLTAVRNDAEARAHIQTHLREHPGDRAAIAAVNDTARTNRYHQAARETCGRLRTAAPTREEVFTCQFLARTLPAAARQVQDRMIGALRAGVDAAQCAEMTDSLRQVHALLDTGHAEAEPVEAIPSQP